MKENVLFIGFVDLNSKKGDSNHFRKLTNFMSAHYNMFIISCTNVRKPNHFQIRFPKNKILRLIYWNIYLFFLICRCYRVNKIRKIYFRESGLVIAPYIAKIIFRIKLYVEINGVAIYDIPIPKSILKYTFKKLYNKCDKIIASRGYASLINLYFKVPYNKIQIVSLGFDFDDIENPISKSINNVELKQIAFIGNIIEYQGLSEFIDGFNLYCLYENANVKLLLIGEGPQKEILKNKVKELNIINKVLFIDAVNSEELKNILSKCHLGISPFSKTRGKENTISALKTYDYLNARLPILTSIMDEMANFVIEEEIGEVIKDYSPEEIMSKISCCLKTDFLLNVNNSYNKNIRIWKNRFSWNTRFNQIKTII